MFENAVKGAMFGLVVGDALGVPVEFRSREELEQDPVTGMRAYGTHHTLFAPQYVFRVLV